MIHKGRDYNAEKKPGINPSKFGKEKDWSLILCGKPCTLIFNVYNIKYKKYKLVRGGGGQGSEGLLTSQDIWITVDDYWTKSNT